MEFTEFNKKFGTEQQCRDYLYSMRWPGGFRCPECQYDKAWHIGKDRYKCTRCRHQVSLIYGTLFQGTQSKLLPCWFKSIWYVSAGGYNMTEMQKISGIGSNNTALKWFRKLNRIKLNSIEYRAKGSITFRELLQNAIDSAP